MLHVRAYSGRTICSINPADRKTDQGRVLDDLAVIAGLHLRVPATRVSIHPVEECEQAAFNPTTTWADCEHFAGATHYELMAVVRHYRDGGTRELSTAIKMERYAAVHSLLEDLVDPNSVIRHEAVYGLCSPLGLAAHTNFGCSCIAEALIEFQADIDGKHFEKSPLMAACESRNTRMASFLIQAGADVNRPTWFTETPLLLAASVNSAPLVRLLLRNRADITQRDPRQRGPVERAFEHEALRAATCLVRAKAQVQPYADDECLLHQAASRGSVAWVKLLTAAGADPQGRDQHGRLAMDVRQRLSTFQQRQQLRRSLWPTMPELSRGDPPRIEHEGRARE
ncbi:unnamed protein product [Symbiodinium necroappetens]|uniref:Uncharacterized protein n=1 Tax=Symbiodinium necroappetens TaxID=1628268 RepID=A0A812XHI8_9DINO|nr:unnamed protein product [Symbiodinium necroappetens]